MKKRAVVLGVWNSDLFKLQEENLSHFRRKKEVCCTQEQGKPWLCYRNRECFLGNRPSQVE